MLRNKCQDVKLICSDLLDELDPRDRNCCMVESLEPQHQPHSLFDATVVLVNQVVEITGRPDTEILRPGRSLLEFGLAV